LKAAEHMSIRLQMHVPLIAMADAHAFDAVAAVIG
jgi:hypothetical protein